MTERGKRAIIVGSSGQDGTLLSELLRAKGYSVLGLTRDGKTSISDFRQVRRLVRREKPDEIYFLAAFHHSSEDRRQEELELFEKSFAVNTMPLLYFLESIRLESPRTRIFYASSSHVFGTPDESPQDESTPLDPENIYGISKATGMMMVRYYRRVHGVFASTGILYNHESPLRDGRFVTKKIVRGIREIREGASEKLVLGDLKARVDWGYAPDYVEAMRRILSAKRADDFVIATGKSWRVGDFARIAFERAGVPIRGRISTRKNVAKKGSPNLVGDSRKLRRATGWKPSVSFADMIGLLVESELKSRS